MKLNSSNHSPSVAARALSASRYPLTALLVLALAACWLVDGTDAALDLEVTLARGMENALRALLRGLCLPSTLTCSIAPACSGLRIATASALFALALPQRATSPHPREAAAAQPQMGGPVARHICRAAIGVLAGLWLNLARLLLIELGTRLSSDLGHTLHAFALPLIIAPLALALCATLPRLTIPARALLATTSALLLALLLNAPAYTIDWDSCSLCSLDRRENSPGFARLAIGVKRVPRQVNFCHLAGLYTSSASFPAYQAQRVARRDFTPIVIA